MHGGRNEPVNRTNRCTHIHRAIGTSTADSLSRPILPAHPDIHIAELTTEDDEGRVASDEQLYPNGRLLAKAPQLLKALEDAFTLLDRIGDTLHYEDGLPVTALESRDIEIIYGDAVTELARFETLIREARRQQ